MKKNTLIFVVMVVSIVVGYFVGVNSTKTNKSSMHSMHDMDQSKTMHNHAMLDINNWAQIPELKIDAIKDAKDGYNIHIQTKNFTFTPENVNTKNIDNQGHAHIFINGIKISRVYGSWYYVSSDKLQSGMNTIEVTLNANDHSELVLNNNHINASVEVIK
jgi:hypothetical protein